jgi:acetyl esterase
MTTPDTLSKSATNPFAPDAIDAETREFNEKLEAMLADVPPTHTIPPEVTRKAREEGGGNFGPVVTVDEAEYRDIPGPDGTKLPIRVMVPPGTVRGVYFHIHGGGWVLGRAHHSDVRNWAIAQHAGMAVVSVDYRLSPECPYPGPADDCEEAALWVLKNAKAEFGADAITIGGESAGAHLAALTLLRLRDKHNYTGWKAANMTFGVFDLTPPPAVRQWGDRQLILSRPTMEWFYECFAGDRNRQAPEISPLYAKLHDMPPALFTVGTMDPLLDDTLFMHARWVAAGNEAELAVYPGGVHGFTGFPLTLGQKANERIQEYLKEKLA